MSPLLEEIRHSPMLWLLAFVPVVFAAARLEPDAHTLLFVLSVLAIVPLAALLSHADGLYDLRHDAVPAAAASAVNAAARFHVLLTEVGRMKRRLVWIPALTVAMINCAAAQQFVYPAKGQSPEKQKSDEAACYTWAVQQTGFDPAKPPAQQPAAAPPTTATGTTPGAGLRGAARGAVVGEVVGGDAGAGAAAGAVAARGQSRRQNAAAAGQAQQQQQAATQQQQATFAKARAACLEGRGYTVK